MEAGDSNNACNDQSLENFPQGCTKNLGQWGKMFNKNFQQQIHRIRSTLSNIYFSPSPWDFNLIQRWEKELDNLLEIEEIF